MASLLFAPKLKSSNFKHVVFPTLLCLSDFSESTIKLIPFLNSIFLHLDKVLRKHESVSLVDYDQKQFSY